MRIKAIFFVGMVIMIVAIFANNLYLSGILMATSVLVMGMGISYFLEKKKPTKAEKRLMEKIDYYLG